MFSLLLPVLPRRSRRENKSKESRGRFTFNRTDRPSREYKKERKMRGKKVHV